jgi:NAD(P) transhydrogenase subunit alpha
MLITNLAILVLAGFVGFSVISKVPNTLHTPLMSGTNAIHGIVVLAGLLVIGLAANDLFNKAILVVAIAFGTINVVGGFLVTDRMLGMFKRKPEPPKAVDDEPEPKPPGEPLEAPSAPTEPEPDPEAEAEAEPAAPPPPDEPAAPAAPDDAAPEKPDPEGGADR